MALHPDTLVPIRRTVHEALADVMGALPAIGRDQQASAQQGGYAYRGIEAITKHLQSLLAEHGVVIVPSVESMQVEHLTVNNKPWTDTTLHVAYTIVGPDGSSLSARTVGIGRDNSDKGANKAMTQAFKYLLLQLFCISDAKDDGDGTTVEADDRTPHPLEGRVREALADIAKLSEDKKAEIREWAKGRKLAGSAMIADEAWLGHVEDWLSEFGGLK